MRTRLLILLLIVSLLGFLVSERREMGPRLLAFISPEPAALPKPQLDSGVRWAGDWYTVEWLDTTTIAIGEPRAIGRNTSYLLLGSERALLFDVGEGWQDLKPVVDDLTSLPVIVLPSHLHYDHVGSIARFDYVVLPDLADLRARTRDGVFVPTYAEHLGVMRDVDPPALRPAEWWKPETAIDLGGREIVMRHTPGHTPESVSLWDPQREWIFTGDYLTPTPLYAFLPGSSVSDFRATARTLLSSLPETVEIFGAHDEPSDTRVPRLGFSDLQDLGRVLEAIGRGEAKASGVYPRIYRVNDRVEIWTDFNLAIENDRPRLPAP